jgi:hypothetical protein
LKLRVACPYCGSSVDTTRQLSDGQFTYRRSGLLGIERNLQGAIPVAMVLQQLWLNAFSGIGGGGAVYLPSLNIEAIDGSWPTTREIDFFAMELHPDSREGQTRVVFGEAKDRGNEFDANDVETMRLVAEKFKAGRFEPYILFAKLNTFSEAEIALAAELAQTHNVILLSDQELEPLHAYDRASEEVQKRHPHDLDGFVQATVQLYPQLQRKPFAFNAAAAPDEQIADDVLAAPIPAEPEA